MTAKPENGRLFLHCRSAIVLWHLYCYSSSEQDIIGKKYGTAESNGAQRTSPRDKSGAKAASKGNVCMYIVPVILRKSNCLINEMVLPFRSPEKDSQSITRNNY